MVIFIAKPVILTLLKLSFGNTLTYYKLFLQTTEVIKYYWLHNENISPSVGIKRIETLYPMTRIL